MPDGLIARIEREAGVPDLLELLSTRLTPTDLQSLLIALHARLAESVTPSRLLAQYETNRFVRPSPADARLMSEVERVAWSLLPAGYAPIELSPLCPLGTNSAVATVSQNKVVSTDRNTEVVADCTNVLALECALRRRQCPPRSDTYVGARILRRHGVQGLRGRWRGRGVGARRRRPDALDAAAARRREGALRDQRPGGRAAVRHVVGRSHVCRGLA